MSNCTFVNGLCPSDLCVLEYNHPFASRHRHITSTTYGSANTCREMQLEILRSGKDCTWDKSMHYMAPKDTSDDELFRLGCELEDKLLEKYRLRND